MKPTFIISLLLFSFIATCTTLAQHSTYHISGRVTDTEGEHKVKNMPGKSVEKSGSGIFRQLISNKVKKFREIASMPLLRSVSNIGKYRPGVIL